MQWLLCCQTIVLVTIKLLVNRLLYRRLLIFSITKIATGKCFDFLKKEPNSSYIFMSVVEIFRIRKEEKNFTAQIRLEYTHFYKKHFQKVCPILIKTFG